MLPGGQALQAAEPALAANCPALQGEQDARLSPLLPARANPAGHGEQNVDDSDAAKKPGPQGVHAVDPGGLHAPLGHSWQSITCRTFEALEKVPPGQGLQTRDSMGPAE